MHKHLLARCALAGLVVVVTGQRLTVSRGYGPSVTYLHTQGEPLLRLDEAGDPDLINAFESLLQFDPEPPRQISIDGLRQITIYPRP